jgi:hypothetical protein
MSVAEGGEKLLARLYRKGAKWQAFIPSIVAWLTNPQHTVVDALRELKQAASEGDLSPRLDRSPGKWRYSPPRHEDGRRGFYRQSSDAGLAVRECAGGRSWFCTVNGDLLMCPGTKRPMWFRSAEAAARYIDERHVGGGMLPLLPEPEDWQSGIIAGLDALAK